MVIFIVCNAPLVAFAWLVFFDSFVLACGFTYFFLINSTFKIRHLTFKGKVAISLLRDSWPLVFSSLAIMLYMKIDQVMIKEILGSASVGLYAAGIKVIEAMYFIPMVIASSVFPWLIEQRKISEAKFIKNFQDFITCMFFGSIVIVIPLYLFSKQIIFILFGENFIGAYQITSIYCWVLLFTFLGVSSSKWLLINNMQKFAMYRTYLGLVINIALNYLWIPKYGIEGAAYATLISQIVASYLGYISNKQTWDILIIQTNAIFPIYLLKRIFK